MKKMNIDFFTGRLLINDNELLLWSYDDFVTSEFYVSNKEIKKNGGVYFNFPEVNWMGKNFFMEIRPSMNNFPPTIFLIDRTSDFFYSLKNWEDRDNLELLHEEECNLITWVRDKIEGGVEKKIIKPPYGIEWIYGWGSIAVQTNKRDFNCGIYISWL